MTEADKIIEAAARAAQGHQQHQQPGVPPSPVPMSVQVTTVRGSEGQNLVALILHTPQGQSVFFFDPEGAATLGKALEDSSRISRSGLEVARFS